MPKLISQFATALEAFRLRKKHLRSDSGETSGANVTDIATVDRDQAGGRVDVFFGHRRTRSTVAIVRHEKLFTFEVRRTVAVALETRLAAEASERRRALAEFLEQWRQR
jgi:hypothetical protein